MAFPATRMRRLRRTGLLRGMVRETELTPAHLVQPLFVELRTDKHRVLHVVSAAIPAISFTADELIDFHLEPDVFAGVHTFEHDDVIVRLPPHPRCLELADKLHFSFGIAFDPEGPARGWPVDNALEWWGRWIMEELLPQFRDFFPPEPKEFRH